MRLGQNVFYYATIVNGSQLTDSLGNNCSRGGFVCGGYRGRPSQPKQILLPKDCSTQHAQVSPYPLAQGPQPNQDLRVDDLSRREHETLESAQSAHPCSVSVSSRTQKEEMLAGKYYSPSDRELVLERQRCSKACWKFNNCTNPNNGVSQEERARHFGEILQLNELTNLSPTLAPTTLSGCVGNNVVVETPFNCNYGYNIHIGHDVVIGKNCTILDSCKVKIGDRCILGPNVNIYTVTLPTDPKRRLGSSGLNLGKPIVIEEDCWIGGGVIILPGRTIKKGSTVGAGSVITKVYSRISLLSYIGILPVTCQSQAYIQQDVPQNAVACGNPAQVVRYLYPRE
jgi:acetyltransferase-like isoleucine patch superfamily enzyme